MIRKDGGVFALRKSPSRLRKTNGQESRRVRVRRAWPGLAARAGNGHLLTGLHADRGHQVAETATVACIMSGPSARGERLIRL